MPESDSDLDPDPYPPSDPGGVDFADSSFESSSLMGGIYGFAFCLVGGRAKDGGSAGRLGCWGGGAVCRCNGGGRGFALGGERMSGCRGCGGPSAGSKVLRSYSLK